MDVKTLRNFKQIVESGSLTAASKRLFIAQPALSNQLKAIEKELGTVLLERNSRHIKLTDTGKLFYERASKIIALEDSLVSEIEDCEKGKTGSLKIASIPSAEITMLEKIIPNFVKEYPEIKYELYEKDSDTVLQLLEEGTVDVGIVRTPCAFSPEMDVEYISVEELVCAYKSGAYKFKKNSEFINITELANLPILIINRYKNIFTTLCQENNFKPNFRCINSQLMVNIKWAEEGLGVAIIPKNAIALSNSPLTVKRIAGSPLDAKKAIVTMKNKYHTKASTAFLDICRKLL